MRSTLALALCAVGASAWHASDYARYSGGYNADEYQPIEHIELEHQELPIAYQPALTEETEIETVTDRVIWDQLQRLNGLEKFTHAHHGSDSHDSHPNAHHEYPEEHEHYRDIEYQQRQPVVVNQ